MVNDAYWGAIEGGGTKFVCAVGDAGGAVLAREVFPTTTPQDTLGSVVAFFTAQQRILGGLAGVGVGCFGPLYLRASSARYGQIGSTPKPGWKHTNIIAELERSLGCPVALDTDVNCALLGEATAGAGRGFTDLIYLTIGTGIGAGVMVDGRIVYGFGHPEVGHMLIPKLADDHEFTGSCPFHQDRCAEGLASGTAITRRWQVNSDTLSASHPAWSLEARYLALLCANLLMTTAPQRIILGGGVMQRLSLFPDVRRAVDEILSGYLDFEDRDVDIEALIVPPALEGHAAIVGALHMIQGSAAVTASTG